MTTKCPDCKHTVNAMIVGQTADEVLFTASARRIGVAVGDLRGSLGCYAALRHEVAFELRTLGLSYDRIAHLMDRNPSTVSDWFSAGRILARLKAERTSLFVSDLVPLEPS